MSNLSLYFKRFFSGTLLSRVSGMVRDLAMAFAFGDHPSVAAFMVAFRFSNLFRRLLGEGPFQSAFIPYFEGLRVQSPEKGLDFFRRLTWTITAFLVCLIGVSEVALYFLTPYFSPSNREILLLTRWLLPGLLFICLYGVNLSLLHCYDTFFVPSVAPLICNAIWIFGALFLQHVQVESAMIRLSQLIVIGFFGQWLLTLPFVQRYAAFSWKELFRFRISPEIRGLIKLMGFGVIGVGALQINAFVDSLFARHALLQGPVYLWYSIRMQQLALSIFGIACVSTIVPRFSRAVKEGNTELAQSYFAESYKRILLIMIPCTFAIFVLGIPSVNLLFGRGHFSEEAVLQTGYCLFGYGAGLVPATLVILYSALFYAKGDFRTPTWIAIKTVLLNILFNALFVFVFDWKVLSIALSTSISAFFNFWMLKRATEMEAGFTKVFPCILMSCAAAGATLLANHLLFKFQLPRTVIGQLVQMAALTTVFGTVSLVSGFSKYLRSPSKGQSS